MNLYSAFKHLAFKFDAEQVHDFTLSLLSKAPHLSEFFDPLPADDRLKLSVGELTWNFPVGLAAGFDKNAQAISFFDKMGFGAIEVGTITKKPQAGNPKPRIFRHPDISSVQNAMGFPNQGADEILKNIQKIKARNICLGSNIGKNKDTTEADTPQEHAELYQKFAPVSDYLVINISSPNTPGLRSFQKKDLLKPLLAAVCEQRNITPRPLFVKVAPDLSSEEVTMLCELAKEYKLSGIIATNTTIQHDYGKGGLSGDYIKPIAKEIRKQVCENLKEDSALNVIGIGGISSYAEIKEFWQQGGGLVQIYTSYIFKGPQVLKEIASDMLLDMNEKGFENIQELYNSYQEN